MFRLLLVLLCFGGCSSRPTPQDSGGPRWPDFRRDIGGGVELGRGDLPGQPDLSSPDRSRRDAPPLPLDLAVTDGPPPDLPPLAGWEPGQLGSSDLHDVACVQGHVFAVGAGGTIFHRSPGTPATTFTPQASGTAADLYTVTFADLTYGATAGNDHQIWETRDLGQTWTVAPQCSSYIFETFYALHLHSSVEGYGAGIAVDDAGAGYKFFSGGSWVCGPGTYSGSTFYGVFRRGVQGWIVGDTGGQIYRTLDGTTWSPLGAGTPWILRDITFTPGGVALATGHEGSIVRSADGDGATWSAIPSGTKGNLMGVAFSGDLLGWIVGAGGQILHTGDGGLSWSPQDSGTTVNLNSVCFTSPSEGWAVGEGGTLVTTTSGGMK